MYVAAPLRPPVLGPELPSSAEQAHGAAPFRSRRAIGSLESSDERRTRGREGEKEKEAKNECLSIVAVAGESKCCNRALSTSQQSSLNFSTEHCQLPKMDAAKLLDLLKVRLCS